ncbi:SDR family NAD(P)-dependent oxidoreductase [Dyella flagellata]|uniref:3-ketoacyl-ACP reductase n=1 Tax=Dyella flagellata TaxID=1867833 RepID=A0ABQ5X8M8_9GAMM|nr:SDR family oxidoreductase [Dyella flagellata]GLQ87935.1 3-ketoacyl-ACP reductase [Dyella flagellata]
MSLEGQPLKGKVALVTGGARGIGGGITRKLAAWGCKLHITYIDRPAAAKKMAAEIEAEGGSCTIHRMDSASPEDIKAVIDSIAKIDGDLNILVHNAAATKFTLLKDASLSDWQFVQDTNSRSTLLLAQYALPLMKNRPGARFLTITNSNTQRILKRAGLFAAAKAGLETLTIYLAYELAAYGIVVNCIRPGLVQTGVFNVRPDFEGGVTHELAVSPWGNDRMTTSEDSGDVVAMMCLDEAAWIAGQTITVDGGFKWWGHLRVRQKPRGQRDQNEAEEASA